jgi:hypothetical protein
MIRESCRLPPAQQTAERQPDNACNQEAPTWIATDLIFKVGSQTLRLYLIHVVS